MLQWVKLQDEFSSICFGDFLILRYNLKHSGALLGSNSVRNKIARNDKQEAGA